MFPQPSGVWSWIAESALRDAEGCFRSWIAAPRPVGAPAVRMLGASTVAHTSRGSPSIAALPPDEGVVLADVDSVRNGRSSSHDRVSGHASADSDDSQMAITIDSVSPADTPFAVMALQIDDVCALHPFSLHKLDAGPVWLMTIAHAFNYRMGTYGS